MTNIGKSCTVKNAEMSDAQQNEAMEIALQALEKYSVQRDIAKYIKQRFDELHGASWHCIVGRNFGSFITHDEGCFIYFYAHDIAILLYRAG